LTGDKYKTWILIQFVPSSSSSSSSYFRLHSKKWYEIAEYPSGYGKNYPKKNHVIYHQLSYNRSYIAVSLFGISSSADASFSSSLS